MAVELSLKSVLLLKGILVSEPILSTSYDFITEWEGIINTVQVRSSSSASKASSWVENGKHRERNGGHYRIEVPNIGGYSILLAHVIPLDATFVIPWHELDRRWLCIHKDRPSRYEPYRNAWHLLKEIH